jgi:hypothetical protein
MKTIYLMTAILLITFTDCFSQNQIFKKNDEAKSQKSAWGFISSDSKITSLNGNNAKFIGGTFGIILKNRTRIGLGGYSLTGKNMFEYQEPSGENTVYQLKNELNYFGPFFEFVFLPDSRVHITIPVQFGGGKTTIKQEVQLNQLSFPGPEEIERTYWATVEKCNLAVIEPGVNVELEILSWMKLDLGASYRFVMGSELNSIPHSNQEFSGTAFHIGLKFICF